MSKSPAFFSPYSLQTPYWLIASGPNAVALSEAGAKPLYHNPELYGVMVEPPWVARWNGLGDEHLDALQGDGMQLAVISAETVPSVQEIELSLRAPHEIHTIAANLWLADYIRDDRLICFTQPVVNREGKPIGHEAFARMQAPDGSIIGGAAIMQASHALHVEYQVDRMMHKQAVECYTKAGLDGLLFINFLTGFIHRPEVYLEGLSQALDRYHLLPGMVVLDVPLGAYAKDLAKLESIAEYCRARGFLVALDDIHSTKELSSVLAAVEPAYIKLDAKLGPQMLDNPRMNPVASILEIAHKAGALVLAEGVESEAHREAYLSAGVDLLQGYLFGAPSRCEASRQRRAT